MPIAGWYDTAHGVTRPFGTEWTWPDPPIGRAMMAAIARKIQSDTRHVGFNLTPTTLLQTPRQIVIERFADVWVDPEEEAAKFMGTMFHAALLGEMQRVGYLVGRDAVVAGRLFGADMTTELDAVWPHGDTTAESLGLPLIPKKPFGWPDIVEIKFTGSNAVKFVLEAGAAKDDHEAQVNMGRLLRAQAIGVAPELLAARIEYYDMPQKENSKILGGWVRMPPFVGFEVSPMDEAMIGELRPGWSPPKKESDPTVPPGRVVDTVETLGRVFPVVKEALRAAAGLPVEERKRFVTAAVEGVVASLPCECPNRFHGTGRTYCSVRRQCAMLDHGTMAW